MNEPMALQPVPTLSEAETKAFWEAQRRFELMHPELHCPVCGHHPLARRGEILCVPSATITVAGQTICGAPRLVTPSTCRHCGHVVLTDVRVILNRALSDAEARQIWKRARDRETWVGKQPKGYEPPNT